MEMTAPFTEAKIRALEVGEVVELTGRIYTGRDAVHKFLHGSKKSPVNLRDGMIYHCGPVVVRENGDWVVKAAGPTTSIREEPYQADIIARFGLRGVIGKGGMGPKTLAACREHGCVYFHAVGGAAQVLASCIRKVHGVYMMEQFGSPEAIWDFEVERFPVVVTMDARGRSHHEAIAESSRKRLGL